MGWGLWQLLPEGLQIRMIANQSDGVTIWVETTRGDVRCPVCDRLSNRVHRYCDRTLADLPWLGRTVKLSVRARHLYCRNPSCPRKVFSERLTGTAGVYARRTDRQTGKLLGTVYELGGEAGARQARATGMPVSGSTLLRLIRRAALPDVGHPVALGVDDWCWKKRQSYGTILVDLESHRPVDLLPDRNSESFAQWLREHPGVRVISRDRGNVYAEGASKGAPDAIQVADRWHLLSNVSDALERVVHRHHRQLRTAAEQVKRAAMDAAGCVQIETKSSLTKLQQQQAGKRDRRKGRYDQVIELHAQGLSSSKIAAKVGVSPETVQRWVRAGGFPEWGGGLPICRRSMLDK